MEDIIKSISTIKNFMGNASRTTCNEYLYEALQDAVESMERDVSVKPIRIPNSAADSCPVCLTELSKKMNFCSFCGNAIDWSE